MNKALRVLLAAMVIVAIGPTAGAAQPAWPSKPVRIIAGGAGSVTDIQARWLAAQLAPALGQAVYVENRVGAGGNIGAEAAAQSAADGYTLLFIHQGTMAINPHLYTRTGYDALADFAPITRFGTSSFLLTVNPDFPARTVADLIRLAKAKPGAMNYGSPGNGTPPHLANELFKRAAGIEATHVPYKGGGPAIIDLLAGRITWTMDGLTAQLPFVKAGQLRALAVTGPRRASSLPDVPTIAESGLPGYEFVGWSGIAAPAATPKPVIARLYAEIKKVLATPEARDWFDSLGVEAGGESPEVFAAFIRAEYAKWGTVIRDAAIKLE